MNIRKNEILLIDDLIFEYSKNKRPSAIVFRCIGVFCSDCNKSGHNNFCVFGDLFRNETSLKTKR